MRTAGLVVLLSLMTLACGQTGSDVPIATPADLDSARTTAPLLGFGLTAHDTCDVDAGDSTDWRMLFVSAPTLLTVVVTADTRHVDGDLLLLDGYGRPVFRLPLQPSCTRYFFSEVPLPKGPYYAGVVCKQGHAAYALTAQHPLSWPPGKLEAPIGIDPVPRRGVGCD